MIESRTPVVIHAVSVSGCARADVEMWLQLRARIGIVLLDCVDGGVVSVHGAVAGRMSGTNTGMIPIDEHREVCCCWCPVNAA